LLMSHSSLKHLLFIKWNISISVRTQFCWCRFQV
jgi:hypothetical protein